MLELDVLRLHARTADPCRPLPPPTGLSTLPFDTTTIGWNGGLPPSSVESFSVTRLWNMPALVRRMVFSLSEYDMPSRGSKTL